MRSKGACDGSNFKGKMDLEHMKGMKRECMEMRKDGKMCHRQMMKKCQMEMSKGACDEMMKQAMAEGKDTAKK